MTLIAQQPHHPLLPERDGAAVSSSSLRPQSSLGALTVTVVAPPQAVKLTEVHIRWNPASLVGLRRLTASLAEQASVSRTRAGTLRLGVGGLEGCRRALTAGGREGGGRGEERWIGGKRGYEGGKRGGGSRVDGGRDGVRDVGRQAEERGGVGQRTWGRRHGGEGERGERVNREFNYGLQDVNAGLATSGLKGAKRAGMDIGEERQREGEIRT